MEATETFRAGVEQVTVAVQIDPVPQLSGDVSGVLGDAHIIGNLNLTGNVFSEGLLTGIDTFHVQGNGFTWFFQNGGQADLHGKVKAPWGPWGTDPTGWVAEDRIAVAPTAAGVYVPSELAWSDWSMARPGNSPDVTLVNGTIAKPEVANLSQSIVFENLSRGFHFHDSAGVQTLSDVKFLNCGTTGVLASYPVHFHLLGDNSRGSVLARVVVEGGKNHAFVPHGSHGVILDRCVAYKTADNDPFWWDRPFDNHDTVQNSNDTSYDHCLVLGATGNQLDLTGFLMNAGVGNKAVGCVVAALRRGTFPGYNPQQSSGFHWLEEANKNDGGNVWEFDGCAAHNNNGAGIFVWQNDAFVDNIHLNINFTAYRNGGVGINHGAYINNYRYVGAVLSGNVTALASHAKSASVAAPISFEDFTTDGPLVLRKHQSNAIPIPIYYRGCVFTEVRVDEKPAEGGSNAAIQVFEDCGLTPANFNIITIHPQSVLEVWDGGVLAHRWAAGVWT